MITGSDITVNVVASIIASAILLAAGFLWGKYKERRKFGRNLEEFRSAFTTLFPGIAERDSVPTVVVVHLEAINHCPDSRDYVRSRVPEAVVPEDGETIDLATVDAPV